MDCPTLLGLDRADTIDRLAEHVHDAAERLFADRDLDRFTGIRDRQAAAQTFARAHRDRANHAVAELLLHL